MATAATTVNVDGLPAGAPTVAQLDALPSRLQVATGIRTGTMQAAVGAISGPLIQAEAAALQASDLIQTVVEEAMTLAAQAAQAATNQALQTIENILAPLVADVQANQPKTRKRCTNQTPAPGAQGPGLSPPPTPPPLGCYWLMPPPGTGQPDLLTCQDPYPADPYGYGPPVRQPSPPPLQPSSPPSSNMVIYTVYANCNASLLAGVPNLTGTIDRQLKSEGWRQVFPPGTIEAGTPAEASQMLNSIAATVSRMCPTPASTPAV